MPRKGPVTKARCIARSDLQLANWLLVLSTVLC